MSHCLPSLLFASVLLAAGSSAHAGLLGSSISVNYHLGATTTTDAITVVNGVEFSCPTGAFNLCSMLSAPTQTVDIGDQDITYRYFGPGSGFNNVLVNGFDFQGLSLGSAIIGINLSTDIAGLDLSRLTFTADSLQIDMHGLVLSSPGNTFSVQLLTSAVPEPTSGALLAVALAAAAISRRRRG